MTQSILFDPLVPLALLAVLAGLSVLALALAIWRRLAGWALRAGAALVLLAALSGPVIQVEDRSPLSDIVIVAEDRTASQTLSDRPDQMAAARTELEATLAKRANTDVRWIAVEDSPDDGGTQLMDALTRALADEPRARVAGLIALSDGQVHDMERAPELPAPLHLLMTGRDSDWDRRLIVRNAPSFGIIGEPITLTLQVEDQGAAPEGLQSTELQIAIDGGAAQSFRLPVGVDFDLPLTLPHGGRNVIEFRVPEAEGELTTRNNAALLQINGVRDRLRVLLVSGAPHPGGRTWRNLLKSDSAVDLVHFTILRPPEKQDGVPVDELSLIAFPTRELFLEKIEDFDLIIFDRYKRRGILPSAYLENVANYVRRGGAVLVAAGPDFASADSIFRTPLAEVLPARPSARVLEEPYRPVISESGLQHPVTAELTGAESWGRWMRQVELETTGGVTLMHGVGERPLLTLDRVEEGRVALLASDHAWLWSRGFEGGGPQLELLRRLAHWMMKEPELEEEVLTAEATGQRMRIERRTLGETVGPVTITAPDGTTSEIALRQQRPGLWEGRYESDQIGLYHLEEGEERTVIGLGPAAPREFEQTIATADLVGPLVRSLRGGTVALEDGMPSLRNIREGRPAAGRGWIGLVPRGAYETTAVTQSPLLPAWFLLLLAATLLIGAWLREGRS
ncbi:MAG: membrane protein [Epibacterium sp.]